jgi:hypothetical protein
LESMNRRIDTNKLCSFEFILELLLALPRSISKRLIARENHRLKCFPDISETVVARD